MDLFLIVYQGYAYLMKIAIYARGVSNSKEISEYECRRDLQEFKCFIKKQEFEKLFLLIEFRF